MLAFFCVLENGFFCPFFYWAMSFKRGKKAKRNRNSHGKASARSYSGVLAGELRTGFLSSFPAGMRH